MQILKDAYMEIIGESMENDIGQFIGMMTFDPFVSSNGVEAIQGLTYLIGDRWGTRCRRIFHKREDW